MLGGGSTGVPRDSAVVLVKMGEADDKDGNNFAGNVLFGFQKPSNCTKPFIVSHFPHGIGSRVQEGQGTHTFDCIGSARSLGAVATYERYPHAVHLLEPASETSPLEHKRHSLEPVLLCAKPEGQTLHPMVAGNALYVPRRHSKQLIECFNVS